MEQKVYSIILKEEYYDTAEIFEAELLDTAWKLLKKGYNVSIRFDKITSSYCILYNYAEDFKCLN